MNALEINSLFINYDKTAVLWDVSFKVPPGILLAIIGPNGAGKSTLLKAILGLIKPFSGSIQFFGEALEKMRSKIAYVPQRETVDWDFPITALELVLMGRYGKLGFFQKLRKADWEAAQNALDQVGMGAFKDRQIGELSGGQQQRLFLARAVVQEPDFLFLDEPFAGVDLATEKAMMEMLKGLRNEGKTVVIVHHDLPSVTEYFDWALLLNTHLIACGPLSEVFREETLAQVYGKRAPLFEEVTNLAVKKQSGL